MLNVSRKIAYSELMIVALVFTTLIPYLIFNMGFTPLQHFHYVTITMFILAPLGFLSLFYFIDRWECRPIEMLSFYLDRGLQPPEDVMAEARVRALNLPLVHSISILVRYEIIVLFDCIYMYVVADLPFRETIRLGIYAGGGLVIFPVFSFFLTERVLYPVRKLLAEKTTEARADERRIITINTRTRVLSILLATVIAPLAALGELAYRRVARELGGVLSTVSPVEILLSDLSGLIWLLIAIAVILAGGIGILLATSISSPLGHMVNVIRELEHGNLKARSHLIANDEIGVLARSFDKMAQEFERNRDALEDLNRNLEQRVAEKTENLTKAYERLQRSNQNLAVANRELEEANKKLKELDRLKSDFISIVSHELRTPLTSIKAFAELMLMKPGMSAEKQSRLIGIINAESDRLARLISEILDLTKIEAGKLTWHIAPLSVEEILRHCLDGIQALADNKSLVVSADISRNLPRIYGDRDRLLQVVTNILSNAIKFTPQGGSITLRAYLETTPKQQIVVEVSDTGVGIPESDLELVFEKFHRTGDLLSGRSEGTGLGLAITRQIVEYHGGKIWATSNLGYGSTFTFTLPLDKAWNIETDEQTAAALL